MKSKAAMAVIEASSHVAQQALFDYSSLDQETQIAIQLRTSEIKTLAKRVASDIVEIGEKLAEVKDRLGGNGRFVEWLEAELGWSERTAYNFMAVHQKFGASDFEIANIATSALYLLAAPSTPAEAVESAKQIAKEGGKVTHTIAKELKRRADARKPKQDVLLPEPEEDDEDVEPALAAGSSTPAETPRRPMEELVATVKKFSGRIIGSTLVNIGFTAGQVGEALDRKLIEKGEGGLLRYLEQEPEDLPEGWEFDDSLEGSIRAICPARGLKTLMFVSRREAILAAHGIEKSSEEGLLGLAAGKALTLPKPPEDEDIAICLCGCRADQHEPSGECTKCTCETYEEASLADLAEAKAVDAALTAGVRSAPSPSMPRSKAWLKSRIEIAITLMPTDTTEWDRKVLYSVRSGDDMPFVAMSAGEQDLHALPPKVLDLLVKLSKHVDEKPAKPSSKPKPAAVAKKPVAKSKAKSKVNPKTKAKGAKK